jgi:hypothetical protein
VNASAATGKKSCSEDRAVMDKPLVGSGCVEGSNAICNIRALSCGAAAIHAPLPTVQVH